jgi:hypothetical protein
MALNGLFYLIYKNLICRLDYLFIFFFTVNCFVSGHTEQAREIKPSKYSTIRTKRRKDSFL